MHLNIYCLFLTVSVQWGLWSISTHIFPFLAIMVEMFPVRRFVLLLFCFWHFCCLFSFLILFVCLFFFLSFFYWRDVWIMEWWSFTILQRLPVSSTYCFHHTLQNAFVLRHDVTKYFTLQSAMESSPKSACKSAFGIGTSFEAITGQLDVLSRSHYSVFYVSWSFKMQLFENIWKDLQLFC